MSYRRTPEGSVQEPRLLILGSKTPDLLGTSRRGAPVSIDTNIHVAQKLTNHVLWLPLQTANELNPAENKSELPNSPTPKPERGSNRLFRRLPKSIRVGLAKAASVVISLTSALGPLADPELAHAQSPSPEQMLSRNVQSDPFMLIGQPKDPELLQYYKTLSHTQLFHTLDSEINSLPHIKKEQLEDNYIRYSYKSSGARPDIIVTQQGGTALFKRMNIEKAGGFNTAEFNRVLGRPEAILPAPDFYGGKNDPGIETWVWPKPGVFGYQGFALVVNKRTGKSIEAYSFSGPSSVAEFTSKWSQGDSNKNVVPGPSEATPEPQAQITNEAVSVANQEVAEEGSTLILIDGLGSDMDANGNSSARTFDYLRQKLGPSFRLIVPFSYNGGQMTRLENGRPIWLPNSYNPEDTWNRSIGDHANTLKDTIDQIPSGYRSVYIGGYSLGGVVAFEYGRLHVLPSDAAHRDGPVKKIVTMHSPLGGVPDREFETTWLRLYPFDSVLANPITQHLHSLARNPEAQMRTKVFNEGVAKYLREKRALEVLTMTNADECLVPVSSAVIQGNGYSLPRGRGPKGALSCEPDHMLYALTASGGDLAVLGHVELLRDPEMVRLIALPPVLTSVEPSNSTGPHVDPAIKTQQEVAKQREKSFVEKQEAVSKLISKPYAGKDFSLRFDIKTNQVIVNLDRKSGNKAEEELDTYLKQNGVEDRSWIKDLVIQYR